MGDIDFDQLRRLQHIKQKLEISLHKSPEQRRGWYNVPFATEFGNGINGYFIHGVDKFRFGELRA
ncbi:MAG: hypothetical protein RIG63_09825 [Coleofasciculus chthonoplastes F3-SA18-01]